MPDLIPRAPDNPEFARVVELRRLRGMAEFAFDISPTPAEAAALARLMGAQAVRKLRFRGRLAALPGGGWRLEGTLGATVVQICVVTLDPLTTRIDQPVLRSYLPGVAADEVMVDADAEDEAEPLPERLDLGLVATEALALALPLYPRAPGAELPPWAVAPPGVQPLEETAPRPFAALAALRGKPDDRS